jgi:hypothetical protein
VKTFYQEGSLCRTEARRDPLSATVTMEWQAEGKKQGNRDTGLEFNTASETS